MIFNLPRCLVIVSSVIEVFHPFRTLAGQSSGNDESKAGTSPIHLWQPFSCFVDFFCAAAADFLAAEISELVSSDDVLRTGDPLSAEAGQDAIRGQRVQRAEAKVRLLFPGLVQPEVLERRFVRRHVQTTLHRLPRLCKGESSLFCLLFSGRNSCDNFFVEF